MVVLRASRVHHSDHECKVEAESVIEASDPRVRSLKPNYIKLNSFMVCVCFSHLLFLRQLGSFFLVNQLPHECVHAASFLVFRSKGKKGELFGVCVSYLPTCSCSALMVVVYSDSVDCCCFGCV